MNETITLKCFADIDLNDTFFDSLKEDYPGFEAWFQKKSENNSKAYVQYTVFVSCFISATCTLNGRKVIARI